MSRLVFDIETNGFDPSEIFCVGIYDLDTREYQDYYGDAIVEGLLRLSDASMVIGHNITGFDVPVIKRLTEGLVTIEANKVLDTCSLSRKLFPQNKNHKLAYWGEILGYPKMEWNDFSRFTPEMLEYMRRDVWINVLLFEFFMSYLYETPETSVLTETAA